MERLQQRLEAVKALASFQQLALLENPNDVAILWFEFSFEVCWKAAKQYLNDIEGLDAGSPKGVLEVAGKSAFCRKKRRSSPWKWLTTGT